MSGQKAAAHRGVPNRYGRYPLRQGALDCLPRGGGGLSLESAWGMVLRDGPGEVWGDSLGRIWALPGGLPWGLPRSLREGDVSASVQVRLTPPEELLSRVLDCLIANLVVIRHSAASTVRLSAVFMTCCCKQCAVCNKISSRLRPQPIEFVARLCYTKPNKREERV